MRIIAMGTGPFAVPSLQALVAGPHEVVQVVCRPPRGRKNDPPAPMVAAAHELGLPCWTPDSVNLPESVAKLQELSADLLMVCDYGEILKPDALSTTRLGGINLHGSLLPKYRGAAPVQWAVLNGDPETGNTVIQMTPGLDAGPSLGQQRVPIDPSETAGELEARLADLGAELVVKIVDQLDTGTSEGTPQLAEQATKAPRLKKSDGLIDWTRPAAELKNQVRGLQPWPRTYTFFPSKRGKTQRVNIDRVTVVEDAPAGPAGTVVEAGPRLLIATGNGALEVQEVQPAGKRTMPAGDFLRGAALEVGTRLLGE